MSVAVRLRRPLRLEDRRARTPRDQVEQPSDQFPPVRAAGYDGVHSPREGIVTAFDANLVRVIAG